MNTQMKMVWPALSALALALALQGCSGGGGGEDKTAPASSMAVNTPQMLTQESAENYDENVNGLISGATLKRWKDDWVNQRPAGITGKLIIFQATIGPVGSEYIKPNGTNVFTYLSPSSEWVEPRNNGVIETPSMVPDGESMDALLKKYNIDPAKDMIVAAMGTGSNPNAMAQGRIWYALRYWGFDKKNLALLNGGNQWLDDTSMTPAADFQATPSTALDNGIYSVKSLKVDNTQLQATVEDMIRVASQTDANNKSDGIMIWDARSLGQYSSNEKLEMFEDTNTNVAGSQACASAYCDPVSPGAHPQYFQNGGSRQGHPNGTLQLQYTHLLDSTKGYAYRPKSELLNLLNGGVNASGIGFVDGSYGLLGSGNAYQDGDVIYNYCETTFRAMITGVAAAVILGKPVRFYDGAMHEWNSLTYATDKNGNTILPADSPWRTDVKSFYRPASSNTLVDARTVTNPYAATTNAIVNADKAYKTGESPVSGGAGGGGGAPSNPCGG